MSHKFSIKGSALLNAIEGAFLFVGNSKTLPVMSTIGFDVEGGICEIRSFNGVSTYKSEVGLQSGQETSVCFTLPAKEILSACLAVGDRNVLFNVGEGQVSVRISNNVYRMTFSPEEEMPGMRNDPIQASAIVNGKDLAKAIEIASGFSASSKDVRESLKAQIFEFNKDGLKIVATDANKLVAIDIARVEKNNFGDKEILVPSEELHKMSKLLLNQPVEVVLRGDIIVFKVELGEIQMLLIDEKPVGWRAVMSRESNCSFTFEKESIVPAMKRAKAFAPTGGSLLMEFKEGTLMTAKMTAVCEEFGREAKESVDVIGTCMGENRRIKVNHGSLDQVLKIGPEMLTFHISEHNKPLYFLTNGTWSEESDAKDIIIEGMIAPIHIE